MTSYISPGVYTVENDLSAYVSDLSATIVGMVGTAPIGPTNTPTLITSSSSFVSTFGNLDPNHYLGYAALAYLKQGNSLWVTRVAASDAAFAEKAFFLPSGYTPYTGKWDLASQTSSAVTLTLTNDSNNMVTLPSNTFLTNFDVTDTVQNPSGTVYSNGKIGSDLASFYTSSATQKLMLGSLLEVTLGAGKGTKATIIGLPGSSSNVQVTLPISAFPVTNSPATAYAVGSIAINPTATLTSFSGTTDLMTLGIASNGKTIKLVYSSNSALQTTLNPLDLASVSNYISLGSSDYSISWPVYDPAVAGNNAKSMLLLKNILLGLLNLVNNIGTGTLTADAADFKTNAAHDLFGTSVSFGVGSLVSGASRGFKAVTAVLDSANNILQLNLDSLISGVSGVFAYSTAAPAVNTIAITVADQRISGSFSTNMHRPKWALISAGTSYVPTIVKIFSIGETDSSNIAVTLNIDNTNITSTGEQQYTLRIYQRTVALGVVATSTRVNDFQLVESYSGTIETIQSSVTASSRAISMKIDYTTYDTVDYSTGTVVNGLMATDNLSMDFVLRSSTISSGVLSGTANAYGISAYEQIFTSFLVGGSAGSPISNYDIIGDSARATGLYSFSNPEVIDINVLVAPGWSSDPAVGKAMNEICINRADAIAVLDPPFGLNVQNAISFRNNIQNINSSYSALYYPWVLVADSVNKKNVFVPPSGLVVAQYAYNDNVADVFYAPAGRTRGTLSDALATERTLTLGDRDQLSLAHINPIHTEAGYGIYIYGQKTLQTQTTALDRVNVRRLMLKLRKVIATASRVFEFQPGDSTTAYQLKQVAQTVLDQHLKLGAIQSYTVDVGPNVNTPLVLENNELHMQISLVPTKVAEIIVETYNILPQGGITVS